MKKSLQHQLDEARQERKKLVKEFEKDSKTDILIVIGLFICALLCFSFCLL